MIKHSSGRKDKMINFFDLLTLGHGLSHCLVLPAKGPQKIPLLIP